MFEGVAKQVVEVKGDTEGVSTALRVHVWYVKGATNEEVDAATQRSLELWTDQGYTLAQAVHCLEGKPHRMAPIFVRAVPWALVKAAGNAKERGGTKSRVDKAMRLTENGYSIDAARAFSRTTGRVPSG